MDWLGYQGEGGEAARGDGAEGVVRGTGREIHGGN